MALWNWSEGPRYSFVVDTSDYSGNFERELCAYVIGTADESREQSYYMKLFDDELSESDAASLRELSDWRLNDPGDDGFKRAPMDLAPTPGFTNDGKGNESKVTARNPFKFPSYQSVAIFLTHKPTKKQLRLLCKRSNQFPKVPLERRFAGRPRTILGCRLVEERIELTSIELE